MLGSVQSRCAAGSVSRWKLVAMKRRPVLSVRGSLVAVAGVAAVAVLASSALAAGQSAATRPATSRSAVQQSALSPVAASALAPGDFTLAVVPDTQNYVSTSANRAIMGAQTRWLVDNRAALNLAFVSHLGDIVGISTSATQWQYASQYMRTLDDAGVPN